MKIKYDDLETAYLFTSYSDPESNVAVIDKRTGEIKYWSEFENDEFEYPKEFDSDDYLWIPHKYDLDLGTNLVFDFVAEFIPEHYDRVQSIFSRKGAYSRYKDFLDSIDMLDKWYEYQNRRIKEALLEWAAENGLEVEE